MKILLLAPTYMGLHVPIVDELKRQKHDVTFFEDIMFSWDWKYPWRGRHDRLFRQIKCFTKQTFQRYWNNLFSKTIQFRQYYDLFIAINGCSFHPILLAKLRIHNPNIKSVLYLWDNSQFYDYYHYATYFNKVMTYDINDSKKYSAKFLPFYWQPLSDNLQNLPIIYKISMIGSNHDGRYKIAQRVYEQLSSIYKSLYLKVLDKNLQKDEIIIHDPIPIEEVLQTMVQSECILDTDRASQSGTTPRLIWALAMGKKVITTNKNVAQLPFFDAEQVFIIDRKNPVIDNYFLEKKIKPNNQNKLLKELRIDYWINNFIM